MRCMKTVRKAAPWVCVLLAVLMLSAIFAGCAKPTTTPEQGDTQQTETDTQGTETADLPALQAGNPAPRADGLYPLNSLYEPGITPDGTDTLQSFSVVSKALVLLGRHASETRSGALLGMTAAESEADGTVTVTFPE